MSRVLSIFLSEINPALRNLNPALRNFEVPDRNFEVPDRHLSEIGFLSGVLSAEYIL